MLANLPIPTILNKAFYIVVCRIFVPSRVCMKKWLQILSFTIIFTTFAATNSLAQCSICTKTAQQLGEKPAKGMNSGILYLAFAPFAIVGYIGYRWWKNNKAV